MADAVNVESLNIQVSAKTEKAVSAFSQLTKTLQDVSAKTEESTSVFAKLAQTLQGICSKLSFASDSFADLSQTLSDVGNRMEQLTNSIEEHSAASAKSTGATQKITKEVSSLTQSANKASPALGRLVNSFKRIILYRTIRTIIKNISAAIREGLGNLKEYSAVVGTAFAPAVDTLRQHVLMLKNSFATALRPVLEALIPIIIRLCDWLSKAADFLAQVFSVLFGKTDDNGRYTKAVLTDLQDSTKEAKKLKKELRSLLGFDEINRLDDNSASAPAPEADSGAATMFTQAEVSEEAKGVAEKLKKIWDIIKGIFDTISNFIKENPWVLKLVGFVLAVAAGLKLWNSYIKPVVSGIGKVASKLGVVGVAVAAVVIAFALFGDKIKEWCDKAKKKVDEFFNKFKEEHPKLAGAIEKVQEVFDFVIETVGLTADAIYKFVHGDFEGGINDITKIGENFSSMIDGWKDDEDSFKNSFLTTIEDVGLGVLNCTTDIARLVNALINGDFEEAKKAFSDLFWDIIRLVLTTILNVVNTILALFSEIVNGIAHAWTWLHNKVWAPAINWLVTAWENVKIFFHNLWVDIKLIVLKAVRFIVAEIKQEIKLLVDGVNIMIAKINEIFGSDIKPIEFNAETTNLDAEIERIEATRLDPLTEPVEFVGQWREPEKMHLKIDTSAVDWAMTQLGYKADTVLQKLSTITTTYTSASGHLKKEWDIQFASGGFPSVGSVFIAGEAGAEWVGNIGGKTGVMNTDQMAQAMYSAMNAALANNPQGGGDIYLDGEVIYRNTVRRNNNRVRATGRSALLT